MNYTPQQFNEMAAKAEGLVYELHSYTEKTKTFEDFLVCNGVEYDAYNDLNQLMPLAWKHDINLTFEFNDIAGKYWDADTLTVNANNKDPIQAIRDCLWQIWSER